MMNIEHKKILTILIATMLAAFTQSRVQAINWIWPIMPDVQESIVQMQIPGVQHDISQVPLLLKLLQNPPPVTNYDYIPGSVWHNSPTVHTKTTDDLYRVVLMQALARLGALGAVPAIDDIIQNNKDEEVITYAKLCKARLLAESTAPTKGNDTSKQLTVKITRFLQEMGFTPESINGSMAVYQVQLAARDRNVADGGGVPMPLEVKAMQEIADIVYRDGTVAPSSIAGLKGLDFSQDVPSALKIRLASLTPQQRVNTLIQELVTRKPSEGDYDKYKMQLLSDEGMTAKIAIAQQLKPTLAKLAPDTRAFADTPGAIVLSRVYNNIIGDSTIAPVLQTATFGGSKSASTVVPQMRQMFIMEY